MHLRLDEIERQIKFRTIETEKVSPRGPQVIVDVKNPGLSVSQWLPTVPRGGANYLGRPEVRATYDIECVARHSFSLLIYVIGSPFGKSRTQ